MDNQLQKTENQISTITPENWQQTYTLIPVKADTSAALITASETPQLCRMGKDNRGMMIGVQVFTILIASTAAFMDGKWSKEQVNECGQLSYDECFWFTVAELKQLLLRIKTGFYTSHKNFSPAVFMEFLKTYSEERMEHRYNHYSQVKQKQIDKPDAKPLTDDQIAELKNNILQIAENMGKPIREIESEEYYQKARAEAHAKLMERRLKEDTL